MNPVPVATFGEPEPATQLRDRLARAGIEARLHDESRIERFWFMSKPFAAYHVQVHQPRYLEALQLISQWEVEDGENGALRQALRCPECRSSRIEYPQMTRKFFTPSLGLILVALRMLPREFYCHDCQYMWPTVEPVPPRLDELKWPRDSKLWHPEKRSVAPVRH